MLPTPFSVAAQVMTGCAGGATHTSNNLKSTVSVRPRAAQGEGVEKGMRPASAVTSPSSPSSNHTTAGAVDGPCGGGLYGASDIPCPRRRILHGHQLQGPAHRPGERGGEEYPGTNYKALLTVQVRLVEWQVESKDGVGWGSEAEPL